MTVSHPQSAIFESHDPTGRGWSLRLNAPRAVHIAHRIDEVLPAIRRAEEAAASGYWVALMIAYEAAPAFDSALVTRELNDFPLVWAAIFEEASLPVAAGQGEAYFAAPWKPRIAPEQYGEAVSRVRSLIASGDTYQVNYTFPLDSTFTGDASSWFRDLCHSQAAGYSALLDLGSHKILSMSPELFVERRGDRLLTRPMKGTMPRGRWTGEDVAMSEALKESAKNRAENLMIVDLLRSDLGKISATGTVRADPLFEVERYTTLWQMTSTIESVCRPETSLSEILRALFPCGSITGAPKVRTMQIIRDLEPQARGVYTGTIGFLEPGGDFTLNVAIRTIVLETTSGVATFSVGGGITYDSTVAGEYEECLLKAKFAVDRDREFDLLETMLLIDGRFPLQLRHIERMTDSASYFGFRVDGAVVTDALQRVRSQFPRGRWKVRLLVGNDGRVRTTVEALPGETHQKLRVALAPTAIDSQNPFLFHKTTNRSVYDHARQSRPDVDDVILWNQKGEITESTIANVVIASDRKKWTPARTSGLLAGTLRGELLEGGEISERVISVEEMRAGVELYLINSVRGWMKAELVD